jgi:hypothetical protein
MKLSFKSLVFRALVLTSTLVFTSCEGALDDIFGEWDKPAASSGAGSASTTVVVTSVELNKSTLSMIVGDADETLTATVVPDNATNKTVTWSSDKETVATVANGVVHAVAFGTAIITAKAGEQQATCTVTVSKPDLLTGVFSVSTTKKVQFSKGNLQATTTDKGLTWSWAFAEQQYDYIGNEVSNNSINGNGTVSTNGSVDLFGWVDISSSWTGAAMYGISNSTATKNTDGYGNVANNDLKSDWGTTMGTGWRTLTYSEWDYLVFTRMVTVGGAAKTSYGLGKVEGKNGLIILPDNWDGSLHASFTYGNSVWSNVYSSTSDPTWAQMEAAGAVFLPAAGYREVATINNAGDYGYYWSSMYYDSNAANAFGIHFKSGSLMTGAYDRSNGRSVRLVKEFTE